MSSKKGQRKRKRRNPMMIFLRIVILMVSVFLISSVGAIFVYEKVVGSKSEDDAELGQNKGSILDNIVKKDVKLNVAVFGVDGDGTRTDVVFVAHFDSKTKAVSLLSIPRDTKVTLTQEIQNSLKADGRFIPYGGVTKFNAVHAYAGKENGSEIAVKQLEDLLDIKIDYYAKIDLDGFRSVVDSIGGVEMDVPTDMDYEDPFQDLYIHLKAGPQVLDGEKAEQLVRFRSYKQGDVQRVEVQQLFLKAFANKILNTKTILSNLPDLISAAFKYVDTNLSMSDALKYVKYVNEISADNIVMQTLPGEGMYIGDISYYVHDEEQTKIAVAKIFNGFNPDADDGTSKNKIIEIANGGNIQGLAANKQKMLEDEGFFVPSISTFTGPKTDSTRIIVKNEGDGNDLLKLFTNAAIEVDETILDENIDIKIILGLEEVLEAEN